MKKNKTFRLKVGKEDILKEEELNQIYGSGNSQIRYIPNEYIQAKILSERGFDLHGRGI